MENVCGKSTSRQFLGGARAPAPATARLGRKKRKESGHTMPLVRCRGWHQASREGGGVSRARAGAALIW